jgi:hypothetical protein
LGTIIRVPSQQECGFTVHIYKIKYDITFTTKLSGGYEMNYRIWIDTAVLFIVCIIWLQALDQKGKMFIVPVEIKLF